MKKKIENMDGKVHTGTMVLRGLGTALKERSNQSYEQIGAGWFGISIKGDVSCRRRNQ